MEGNAFFRGGSLEIVGLSGVEGSRISLVVLCVVECHDLLRDEGLEPIVGVRQGEECGPSCCGWWGKEKECEIC